jgi:hypothetical protein
MIIRYTNTEIRTPFNCDVCIDINLKHSETKIGLSCFFLLVVLCGVC